MRRWNVLGPWMAVLLLAGGLVGFALLPGQAFVPLLPEDFPAWQVGRAAEDLAGHPHPNYTMSDVLHLLVPGLTTTRRALEAGRLPLWDPSQALGVPHLAEVHYGVLYPPTWAFHVLGIDGLGIMAFAHLALAGLGTLLYMRALGRSSTAALVAALAFCGSAWVTARLHSFPVVGAAIWAPWILWGLERAQQRRGLRFAVASAMALALSVFAGHPQTTMWVVVLVVWIELARLVATLAAREPAGRVPLRAALALGLGALLALPQLVPTLDYLRAESQRATVSPDAIVADRLEPPLFWHLLTPDRYADASLPVLPPHPLALRDLDQAQRPVAVNRAEVSMAVGVVPLALAVIAMLLGRGWRARAYALLVILVFAVLGSETLLRPLAAVFPPLGYGNPKRLLVLSTFGLAVLAGAGVDMVRHPRLAVGVTGWIVAVVVTILAVVARVTVPRVDEGRLDAWVDAIVERVPVASAREQVLAMIPEELFARVADTAAASANIAIVMGVLAIILLRPRRHHTEQGWRLLAQRLPGLLPLLVMLELWLVGFPLLRGAPVVEEGWLDATTGLPRAPQVATTALLVEPDPLEPVRLARFGAGPPYLRPNLPSLYGLQDVQCYAPMAPVRVVELLRTMEPTLAADGSSIHGFTMPGTLALPLLDVLGVRVVLTEDATLQAPGLREVATLGPLRVLENEEALGRAFLVDRREVVPAAEARLARLADPRFDPRASVLLEVEPRAPGAIPDAVAGVGDPGAAPTPRAAPEPDAGPAAAVAPEPAAQLAPALATEPESASAAEPEPEPAEPPVADDETAEDPGLPSALAGMPSSMVRVPDRDTADAPEPPPTAPEPGIEVLASEIAATGAARQLVMAGYEPGRIRILVGPGPATHLVVSETWAPGWTASVNGAAADVLVADHALLGLDLPWSQPLDIVLQYRPTPTRVALGAGAVAWLLALVLVAWPRPRRAR